VGIESLSETAQAETGKAEPSADHAFANEQAEAAPEGFATSKATEQIGGLFDEPSSPPGKRDRLRGGTLGLGEALKLLNSHYFIGKSDQESGIFRIRDDGSLAHALQEQQFKLEVANIFVKASDGSNKPIKAEKFWKEHQWRHERTIVFKPRGTTDPSEFNLWRGFGVEPRKGWQKQRRLLRHIWKIICRGDKEKFRYLMRWLAWAVQNPDSHSEVVIVLKSPKQGTGKSTLGAVMLKIFGTHGALIDDKDRLLGRFNDWLETTSFVLGEEIMWAGDPQEHGQAQVDDHRQHPAGRAKERSHPPNQKPAPPYDDNEP